MLTHRVTAWVRNQQAPGTYYRHGTTLTPLLEKSTGQQHLLTSEQFGRFFKP